MSLLFLFFALLLSISAINRSSSDQSACDHSTGISSLSNIKNSWAISNQITNSFDSLPCLSVCLHRKVSPVLSFRLSFLLILAGDVSLNPGPKSTLNNLTFGLVNARSVKNKTAAVSDLVSSKNIDILALTETWLREDETNYLLSDVTPGGFCLAHKPRNKKCGGGVAFMVSSLVKFSPFPIPSFSSFESIAIKTDFCGTTSVFICIYRPPGHPTETFFNDIAELFENVSTSNFEIFVAGDFNLHLEKNSQTTTKFYEILHSFDLKQWVDFPTNHFGHWLDLIITRASTDTVRSVSYCEGLADHSTILSSLNFARPQPSKEKIDYRQLNKIELNKFIKDIANSELILTPSDNISELCAQYNHVLTSILNKHAPIKTKHVSQKLPAPWMSDEIFKAKALRRKYERIWRKTHSIYYRSKFRLQSNLLNRMLERAKTTYLTDFVENHSDNPKNLWKGLNKILHRKPPCHLPEESDLNKLCNNFSNFFVHKINNIREGFTKSTSDFHFPSSTSITNKLTQFKPVSKELVRKLIMKSSDATSALDPLPTALVKSCISVLLDPITNIINMSISTATVPECFKKAHIKPLLKKPSLDKNEYKNYRPISNLSFISKILEKVILLQLQKHLCLNNMLNSFQSAYRKFHSTETALLKMQNDIASNTDRGYLTAMLLLDLSAAFDTIEHSTLLKLLASYFGISDLALNWFISYLTNRFQLVKIKESFSTPIKLGFGVPQGSVLGPVLFTLYTSPLSTLIQNSGIQHHLYADDTQLHVALTPANLEDQICKLQTCAKDISKFMNGMMLKLNPEKTEFLVIGPKRRREECKNSWPLHILDTKIEPVEVARNLGVLFDADLSFKKHISIVIKNCFFYVRDFKRIRRCLTLSASKTLATSLIGSRLDYCNSLFSGLPQKDLIRLQRIQNCLARTTLKAPRFSPSLPLLKTLHWLPIKHRISYKICSLGFQSLTLKEPVYLFDTLNFRPEVRNLRSSGKRFLTIPKVSRIAGSRAFSFSFPTLWNSLPEQIRNAPDLHSFKKQLKTHLFRLAFGP